MLDCQVLNRGDWKIKLKHMLRQAFSYCLSTNKRSGFTINQVPLFGPIVGEDFVEEEVVSDDNEAGADNDEIHEDPEGPKMIVMEESVL